MWAPLHMRKVFVGGLDYSTTDETLSTHFSQYGEVVDAVVMKDPASQRSRGFGFVTYANPDQVDVVQKARPHKIDGRLVETKRAVPKYDVNNSILSAPNYPDATHTRIFIGGLPQEVKESDLESYFKHFGSVTCVNIMYDKNSGRHRGFAFVDFNDYDPVDKVLLTKSHVIKGRPIDVKKAISKSDIGKFRSLMTGVVSPDALSAGIGSALFPNSLSRNGNGMQSIPNPAVVSSANGTAVSASGTSTTAGAAQNSNQPVLGFVPPFNGHVGQFVPRLPYNAVPGFCAQLRSGWQYSVTRNVEVLRNTTGVKSDQPSGAPSLLAVTSASNLDFEEKRRENEEDKRRRRHERQEQPRPPPTLPCESCPRLFHHRLGLASHIRHKHPPPLGLIEDDVDSNSSSDASMTNDQTLTDPSLSNDTQAKTDDCCPPQASILLLEPFYGGSHKQLIATLRSDETVGHSENIALLTLPSKKWHWKARTSALYFSQKIPHQHCFKVLFASSILNLCELVAMRPDLALLKKILYFHENQLVYPVQKQKERDFQYGYNQILSCLIADRVVFNSQYNLESFVREIPRHLRHQPKPRPDPGPIVDSIKNKSQVLYFPVNINHMTRCPKDALESLHIIWPHRWEHDKDPVTFFQVLFQLANSGLNFRLSILGESFSEIPAVFTEAKAKLGNYINQWGFVESKERYWEILHSGDVVVSTAHHEFFGVGMLEAVGAGCFPLCPNRLVYPEIFPQDCLYNTTQQLEKSLSQWCVRPQLVRSKKVNLDLNNFSWNVLRPKYEALLNSDSFQKFPSVQNSLEPSHNSIWNEKN